MTSVEPLNCSVAADPVNVGQVREEFSRWLRRLKVGPTRHSDMVLAVNEALANAAEFAYSHKNCPGTVSLKADYDTTTSVVHVAIVDEGAWREPTPDVIPQFRGRGIPLMQALSDEAAITKSPRGTTVRLRFDNIGDMNSALL